jgi:LAS superfamily LD-carboxypeptidase LdcB
MSIKLPIKPVIQYPAVSNKYGNGNIPFTELHNAFNGGGYLTGMVYWQLALLVNAAKAAGFNLTYSPGGCYRSYASQYSLFLKRYTQCSYATYLITASAKRKKWVRNGSNTYWKLNAGMAMAAVPGTSNHGRAIAIDLALGDSPKTCKPLTTAAIHWLIWNVQRFGFSFEHQSEPWHLRYLYGDKAPSL